MIQIQWAIRSMPQLINSAFEVKAATDNTAPNQYGCVLTKLCIKQEATGYNLLTLDLECKDHTVNWDPVTEQLKATI